jgi:hypothetical protein
MTSSRSRPLSRLLLGLAAVAVTVFGLVAPASATTSSCHLSWGSLPKVVEGTGSSVDFVTAVRAGQHACYDRLVIDISGGPATAYDVQYVSRFRQDGSGKPIPLRGGAVLQVLLRVPSYDVGGHVTYQPANPQEVVSAVGFSAFRQVGWGGSFEGYTSLGIGTRAHLPFRVFTLAGPGHDGRLVVDVARRW